MADKKYLNVGDQLDDKDALVSDNGMFRLSVENGNLVERGPDDRIVWQQKTPGGTHIAFDSDAGHNGHYSNRLVVKDKDGNQVWPSEDGDDKLPGKVGKAAKDSDAKQFVLGPDGNLIAYDSTDTDAKNRTADHIVWSSEYSAPQDHLVVPQGASDLLINAINSANSRMKNTIDKFGKGNPKLPAWAYPDESALSAAYQVVASYDPDTASGATTDAYMSALTYITDHSADAGKDDKEMATKVHSLGMARSSYLSKIDKMITELNEQLNAISMSKGDIPQNTEASVYIGVASMAGAVAQQAFDYADYSRQLAGKPPAASTDASTKATTQATTKATTQATTKASTATSSWEDGYKAGRASVSTGGNDYYTGNPSTTTTAADTTGTGDTTGASAIDFSNLFGDVVGSSGLDSISDTTGSSSDLLGSYNGQTTDTGATGSGSGQTTATPATESTSGSGSDMSGIMQAMELSSLMGAMKPQTQNTDPNHSKDDSSDQQYQDDLAGQNADQASYAGSGTDPQAAVPPTVSAPAANGVPPVSTGTTVDFPLPDGTTLHLPSTVADALNRELHGSAVTADAAYSGTPGASSADHRWTTVNDLSKLGTGDVVKWADGSDSMVVKSGANVYYVDNHQLVPLDTSNPQGNHGAFQGFFHPTGLDAPADATGDPSVLNPSTSATLAAAAPPPVSTSQDPSSPVPPKV